MGGGGLNPPNPPLATPLTHRNMYSMKTIEYLMLKQKKMTLDRVLSFLRSLCVVFFTNEKCNEMMRWISLINKLILTKTFHKVV